MFGSRPENEKLENEKLNSRFTLIGPYALPLHFCHFFGYTVCVKKQAGKTPNQVVLKQGRNHGFFLGKAKPMGGHNLPPVVEIGST